MYLGCGDVSTVRDGLEAFGDVVRRGYLLATLAWITALASSGVQLVQLSPWVISGADLPNKFLPVPILLASKILSEFFATSFVGFPVSSFPRCIPCLFEFFKVGVPPKAGLCIACPGFWGLA